MGFWDFLNANAAAGFGLVGTVTGTLITGVITWRTKRSDYSLAAAGKILDRRIAAHESVLGLAMEMRAMGTLGEVDAAGEVRRMPLVMISRDAFEGFMTRFAEGASLATSWLELEPKREVHFVQDYILTLYTRLQHIPSDDFPEIGERIRLDFINLSSDLEKCLFKFFQKGLLSMRPAGPRSWHKYKKEHTEARLATTRMASVTEALGSGQRTS